MFTRIRKSERPVVSIYFDDIKIEAVEGETVATALLVSGYLQTRFSPRHNAARGPYCMVGVCQDCLVEIDSVPNVQACLAEVKNGMQIRRETSKQRRLDSDL